MKTQAKKTRIKKLVKDMLKQSNKSMIEKIDKALNTGAIDIEGYDPKNNFMILPKIVLITILENEADQYKAKGTSFEKRVKRETKNLKYFL